MKHASRRFYAADICLLAWILMPLATGVLLKALTAPPTDGIVITGAQIYFVLPTPIQPLPVTESQINSWLVMLSITGLCLYLTHGIRAGIETRRQAVAEWIVEKAEDTVRESMGDYFAAFAPLIAAVLALSALSGLISLLGLYPPTSDLNVVAGWSVLVFLLITYYKGKCGFLYYVKSFGKPVALLAPMNVISELAVPFSMAFRHYGNILSGSIVSVLAAAGLRGLSHRLFGALPGMFGQFPYLRIGLPALLSLYFDVFSSCLQAYIFAVLTMLYVSNGFPAEEYEKRRARSHSPNKHPLRRMYFTPFRR